MACVNHRSRMVERQRFQIGVRAVRRAVGDYDDFISVRRIRLSFKGRDDMSQSAKTIVRRYDNTEMGAVHCLGLEFGGTGSIAERSEPTSYFTFLQLFASAAQFPLLANKLINCITL